MKGVQKVILGISILGTLIDSIEKGYTFDKDEVEDAIAMFGLSPRRILFDLHPLEAIQEICKEIANVELSEEEIKAFQEGLIEVY